MRKIKIADATPTQMRQFAEQKLGITLATTMRASDVRAAVSQAWADEYIEVVEAAEDALAAPDAHPAAAPAAAPSPAPGRQFVTVLIDMGTGGLGDKRVELGCNGRTMLVDRGVPQRIPVEFYESLKNANTLEYVANRDGNGVEAKPREIPLYPHRIIG